MVNVSQVARAAGCSTTTVIKLIHRGVLPATFTPPGEPGVPQVGRHNINMTLGAAADIVMANAPGRGGRRGPIGSRRAQARRANQRRQQGAPITGAAAIGVLAEVRQWATVPVAKREILLNLAERVSTDDLRALASLAGV